jgi:hypothetical protein
MEGVLRGLRSGQRVAAGPPTRSPSLPRPPDVGVGFTQAAATAALSPGPAPGPRRLPRRPAGSALAATSRGAPAKLGPVECAHPPPHPASRKPILSVHPIHLQPPADTGPLSCTKSKGPGRVLWKPSGPLFGWGAVTVRMPPVPFCRKVRSEAVLQPWRPLPLRGV